MRSFNKVIKKQRNYFKERPVSFRDQKSLYLSLENKQLDEIIELIIWSSIYYKRNLNDNDK